MMMVTQNRGTVHIDDVNENALRDLISRLKNSVDIKKIYLSIEAYFKVNKHQIDGVEIKKGSGLADTEVKYIY